MKLYLLTRKQFPGYDEAGGFVVAADTQGEARWIASERAGDELADTWLSEDSSTCKMIATRTSERAGVVLRDFRAG